MFTILAVEFDRAGDDTFFIVENRAYQGCCSRSDAVFCAALAGKGEPAALDSFFLDGSAVEFNAELGFDLVECLAVEVDLRPGSKLRVAVFAHHESKEAAAVEVGSVADGVYQTGRVEHCACAENVVFGQAR